MIVRTLYQDESLAAIGAVSPTPETDVLSQQDPAIPDASPVRSGWGDVGNTRRTPCGRMPPMASAQGVSRPRPSVRLMASASAFVVVVALATAAWPSTTGRSGVSIAVGVVGLVAVGCLLSLAIEGAVTAVAWGVRRLRPRTSDSSRT